MDKNKHGKDLSDKGTTVSEFLLSKKPLLTDIYGSLTGMDVGMPLAPEPVVQRPPINLWENRWPKLPRNIYPVYDTPLSGREAPGLSAYYFLQNPLGLGGTLGAQGRVTPFNRGVHMGYQKRF
jgi:hypothetical protein